MDAKKRKIFIEVEITRKGTNSSDQTETVLRDAITKVTSTISTMAQSYNSYVDVKFDIWTNPDQ